MEKKNSLGTINLVLNAPVVQVRPSHNLYSYYITQYKRYPFYVHVKYLVQMAQTNFELMQASFQSSGLYPVESSTEMCPFMVQVYSLVPRSN